MKKIIDDKEITEEEIKEDINDEKEEVVEVKEEKQEKATFIQRFFAYVVDVLIITVVASLICTPFVNTKNTEAIENTFMESYESYSNGEITFEEFSDASINYNYNINREEGIVTVVTIVLQIIYFGVVQLYLGGQTLGKKFGKICVVSDNGKLTMNQLLFRSLIIDSILLDIICFASLLFMSKSAYLGCYTVFEVIQYVVLLVSALLVMFGKSRKGLHDMIAHTSVIKC